MTNSIYPNQFGDQVLYDMCAAQPGHTDPATIHSKLWLIGKSYSVSLDRKAGDKDVLAKASKALADSNLDEIIGSVAEIELLTPANLPTALQAHAEFNTMLKKLAKVNRRSLASKYLHFHKPKAFFIYDSFVDKHVRKWAKRERYPLLDAWKGFDRQYAEFCVRAIAYRDAICPGADPRGVDRSLYPY